MFKDGEVWTKYPNSYQIKTIEFKFDNAVIKRKIKEMI